VLVKASVSIAGYRGNVSGVVLVDTGASVTLLNEDIANEIGVKYVGRRLKLIAADGREVVGELAIVNELVIEGEKLPEAHVAVLRFSREIKERLKAHGLADWCTVGLSTLEILGLVPNTTTGRVEKVGALLLITKIL